MIDADTKLNLYLMVSQLVCHRGCEIAVIPNPSPPNFFDLKAEDFPQPSSHYCSQNEQVSLLSIA